MGTSSEHSEPVQLGFSIADGEHVVLEYDGADLLLRFVDWQDSNVAVRFREAVASRWQRAEEVNLHERLDAAHVVHGSAWLAQHVTQKEATPEHRHLKLNFNAAGVLEVICAETTVWRTTAD